MLTTNDENHSVQSQHVEESAQEYVYVSFSHAKQQLHDIEPIDYFFAKELAPLLIKAEQPHLTANFALCYHLLIALSASVRNGHTCLPIKSIAQQSFGFKSDNMGVITHHGYLFPSFAAIEETCQLLNISDTDNSGIVYQQHCLYMRRNYHFEQELGQHLQSRMADKLAYQTQDMEQVINQLFNHQADEPKAAEIDWQKVAVANSLNKRVSVIAGGPGTGKTYTVTKLLAAIISLNEVTNEQAAPEIISIPKKIALVAPTGKAAQRLTESISQAVAGFSGQIPDHILSAIPTEAKTLHRFLGVIPNHIQFKHNQDNLIDCDVVILDEVSMVDLALMTRLFRALPSHTQVIMLGDADQLPSVALGSVLADIAPRPHPGYSADNTKVIEKITAITHINKGIHCQYAHQAKKAAQKNYGDHLAFLYKSRRFDGKGGIGLIAKAVIEGNAERAWQLLYPNSKGDTQTDSLNDKQVSEQLNYAGHIDDALPDLVRQYYAPILQERDIAQGFKQLSFFRVLAGTRKGEQGVEYLNEHIAQLLGKQLGAKQSLYHGLPIMVNENNYSLGLYNGDVGIIWTTEQGHLVAAFECPEQGYRFIMPTRLPSYEPVYAMTIHKTQGSEFSHVYMVLSNQQDNKLLSRELLYTGITRAKRKLTITTLHRVWYRAVETQVKRFSNLTV